MMLRLLLLAVASALACAPGPAVTPPVEPPLVEDAPVLPDFMRGNPEGCPDRIDNDADGEFEELRNVVLDDTRTVIIQRTHQIEGVGRSLETLLPLDDGLVHDLEFFLADDGFGYGNTHFTYDAEGRLLRELAEGSDARFPVLVVDYTYDGDNLVLIDEEPLHPDFRARRIENDYDDEGRVIERRTDNGKNGVDLVERFVRSDLVGGGLVLAIEREDVAGIHYDTQTFDAFGVMLRREFDNDADGALDEIQAADIEDGKLIGFDFDFDGDGPEGFTARLDYAIDEENRRATISTTVDGVLRRVTESDYGCYVAPVERGTCDAPFVDSAAFGCSRFRFAPAMDGARGKPAVIVTDAGPFFAIAGYASFVLGPIHGFFDVVDVDGVEPIAALFEGAHGNPAVIDNLDGSALVVGGLRNGDAGTGVARIDAQGAEFVDSVPARFGGRGVRFPNGVGVVVGGLTDARTAADAQFFDGSQPLRSEVARAAPFNATFTLVDDEAFYLGGDDGQDPATSQRAACVVDADGVRAEGLLPFALTRHAAAVLDGAVLLIGGERDGATSAATTLVTRAGTAINAADSVALPLALTGAAAVTLDDGRVFVAGGFDEAEVPSALTFVFDGSSWLGGPPLQIARGDATAAILADGRVVVVGGSQAFGSATSAVEVLELP